MSAGTQVDYGALAAQYGGAAGAPPDYAALAQKYGGQAAPVQQQQTQPQVQAAQAPRPTPASVFDQALRTPSETSPGFYRPPGFSTAPLAIQAKPRPLNAAEQEFNQAAGPELHYERPPAPAPRTFAEEAAQMGVPLPKPQLVPNAPERLAQPATGPQAAAPMVKDGGEGIDTNPPTNTFITLPSGERIEVNPGKGAGEIARHFRQEHPLIGGAEDVLGKLPQASIPESVPGPAITGPNGERVEINPGAGAEAQAAAFRQAHPVIGAVTGEISDFLRNQRTPENLALLAALPESRLITAFFSAQAAHGAYANAEEAYQAFRQGNNPEAARYVTESGLNGLMAGFAGYHAARGHAAPNVPRGTSEPIAAPAAPAAEGDFTGSRSLIPRAEPTAAAPPMGAPEPESGRPVLQQSPRPEVNQAAATAEHPAVRQTIEQTLKPVQGATLAGARPEKEADRTQEKIEKEGQTPRTVRDYSGFRIAVDSPAAADAAAAALGHAFEVVNRQDEFVGGNPETGFHGLTLQLREPGSPVSHEVQILPREVEANADSRHDLYEKARDGDEQAQAELRRRNQADYQKFVDRQPAAPELERGEAGGAPAPKFKFGSTQANIPADSEAAQALKGAQQRIAPEDRAGDVNDAKGGVVEQPHVTLRYGIKGEDTAGIRAFLERQAPFEATMGATDTFPPSEHSDGAAAVIAPVEAPELRRIEAALEQHGDFKERSFPEYKPHATLGYVKPEAAAKYKGMPETAGKKFIVNSVGITDRNGNVEEVRLGGPLREGASAASERRQDQARRARVAEMTPEAMRRELLTSEKTGLPNRRAYDEAQRARPAAAVAMSDADGLKALNDRFGYAAGDALLRAKAEALREAGIEAYHDKGDEFLYRGQSPEALARGLEQARKTLKNRVIEVTVADGAVRRFKGADFSYGTGTDEAAAEAALKQHKGAREAAGERARGELRGIAEIAPRPGEEPTGAPGEGELNAVQERGAARVGAYPGRGGGAGGPEEGRGMGPGERGPETAGSQREGAGGNAPPVQGIRREAAREVEPAHIGPMEVADLNLDPRRFQYKLNTGEGGVTDLLRGQVWNPQLAGAVSVWRDPADGKVYVVNGHHRVKLAKENGIARINVEMLDEPDAAHARSTGALQNIAKGRGTELDAAKFFRDTGWTAKDLVDRGVSLKERTAADGMALSRLSEPIFDRVVSGQMRMGRALALARAAETPEAQEALLGLIRRQEMKGKRVTDDTVEELGRMVRGAQEHAETQQTLFGEQEMRRNLAFEKAEISAYIREEIGREKRLFGSVATRARAEALGTQGNVIEPERNAEVARSAAQAQELYDRLSTRTGTVDDVLNTAAKELAEGKENPNAIKQQAYEGVRRSLAEAIGQGQGPGGEGIAGGRANAGAGAGRGEPAAERAGTGGAPAVAAKGEVVVFADGRAGVVQHAAPEFNGRPARLRVRMADGHVRPNVRPQDVQRVQSPAVDPDAHWIGVDLDGTLAHYDGFKGQENIGQPVPAMVERIKGLLAEGRDVRIFTARVSEDPGGLARASIEAWSREHLGKALPVTDVKDDHMERAYGDRLVQVERNTGQIVGGENGEPQQVQATAGGRGAENRPAGGTEREPAEVPGRGAAAAPYRGAAQAQATQDRLLAAGRFKREIEGARQKHPAENAFRGKPERIDLDGAPALRLDAHAYEAIHKTWFPETRWPGVFLAAPEADGLVGELRASESRMRQQGMSANAGAMGKLAGMVEQAREADGNLLLLRADADEPTIREELWHRWYQRAGLRGSAAMREVTRRPEFEAVHAQLIRNGYHLSADDAAAEVMAKALAGDPAARWDLNPGLQEQIAETALKAAVDEAGPGVLNGMPAADHAVEEAIERAREYGRGENDQGRAAGAARGVDQEARGEIRQGEREQAPNLPPGAERGPGSAGAGPGERAGGAQEAELRPTRGDLERAGQGGLFARRPPPPLAHGRLPGEVPLPGMEGAIQEQDEAAAEEQGRELAARMLEPKGDISRAAGEMERLSPLFRGAEGGPQGELFGGGGEPSLQRGLFKREQKEHEEHPPVWYLKSDRLIDQKVKGPMQADAVLRMLENNGVKADELEWTGLGNALKAKGKDPVRPAQLKQLLAANDLRIQEVTKGADPEFEKARNEYLDAEEAYRQAPNDARARARAQAAHGRYTAMMPGGGSTKFGAHSLPGGENYREMLLTLDPADWAPPGSRAAMGLEKDQDFRSGHWEEPNVVGHVRFNDRTGPNGERLLHLEELQSDWHQKGRKYGYAGPPVPPDEAARAREEAEAALAPLNDALRSVGWLGFDSPAQARGAVLQDPEWAMALYDDYIQRAAPGLNVVDAAMIDTDHWDTRDFTPEQIAVVNRWRNARAVMDRANAGDATRSSMVPDAPFKKTWPELLFKRMVRYAAENGYDGITWTPGEQQAQRYDLSKHIDRLHVLEGHYEGFPGDKLGYNVTASKNRQVVIDKRVTPDQLPDLIGKDLAQKALDQIEENKQRPVPKYSAEMHGLDLKVGGEGMKGFYDKIVPAIADKIGKPFGAKMGETELPDNKWRVVEGEPRNGQPDYSVRSVEGIAPAKDMHYYDRDAAEAEATRLNREHGTVRVPYLAVTDAMRKSVMEGQPLFARNREQGTGNTEQEERGPEAVDRAIEAGIDARRARLAQDQLAFGGPGVWQRAIGAFRSWRDQEPNAGEDVKALIRDTRGQMDRDVLQLKKSLEDARKDFVTMPRNVVVKFIDSIERGDMESIPQQHRQLAEGLHAVFVSDRLELQRLDPELLKTFYENYFPHIWDHSGKVARQMRAAAGQGKSLFGSGSFLMHRTVYPPTFKEGIAIGLEPKTWNPVDMALLKHAEIQRYIFGLETVQRMKAEGLARFYKSANDAPPGWVPLDDRFATVTRRNDDGERVLMGHYYAPADAAKPFNNFVSRGLQGRSRALDAAFSLNDNMNSVQLGLSAFHATANVLHSAVADVALGLRQITQGRVGAGAMRIGRAAVPGLSAARAIRLGSLVGREYLDPGSAARYEAEATWLARSGGRPEQSLTLTPRRWRQMAEDIRQRNWAKAGKGALPAALDAAGGWLMHGMVPRIKMGVFQDMAANILEEADRNSWDDREIRSRMQKAWDAVDNRFGQMVYDNLFWHRTALDAARLGIRSVGWNLGSAREYGGGATDAARNFARALARKKPELTARTAFTLATPIYFAMATAAMDYLLTGNAPDEKKHGLAAYFFPEKADGTLLSFPGYMKDWYAFAHDPAGTAIHKASPLLMTMASMMQNKDYYGDKIRNLDDPMVRQAWDAVKYLGEQYVPFSVRSFQEQREKAGGGLLAMIGGKSKGEMGVLGYAGFQPATLAVQDTAAMNLARHYEDEAPEAPRTAESRAHSEEVRALVAGLRQGHLDEKKLEEAFKAGKLNGRDWRRAKREAYETPLAVAVGGLSLPQAVEVWKKATPEERAGLGPVLRVKLANEAKQHPDLVANLPQALLRGMAGID